MFKDRMDRIGAVSLLGLVADEKKPANSARIASAGSDISISTAASNLPPFETGQPKEDTSKPLLSGRAAPKYSGSDWNPGEDEDLRSLAAPKESTCAWFKQRCCGKTPDEKIRDGELMVDFSVIGADR